ncbi:Low-affinity iron/zinc ion transport protein fet4 [Erysiphe necator]|uniref:Putative low affinity iron transporter n=1 Tax=Uncinula necator TaxID=52586 RepID=A0A0B1P200_UNCNE|nr:Low-affinity iron/zinc ion transport protein fet4 [Erysiphe necator]KHJ30946.1 putative low affinity iron transporter [Erysiphe necator]
MSLSIFKKILHSVFPERTDFFAAATTQELTRQEVQNAPYPRSQNNEKDEKSTTDQVSSRDELSSFRKPNIFDQITVLAGSSMTFLLMLFLVGVWISFGIVYGITDKWQIVFQNASSIQVYVIDILLIRQQQNASRALMTILAEFHSRRLTLERLLNQIPGCDRDSTKKEGPRQLYINGKPFNDESDEKMLLPPESMSSISYAWSQTCLLMARGLGSMWTFFLYWIGIGAWVAVGPYFQFSDTWQLYINTITALVLTFTSVFLQNIQQRQEDKLKRCLEHTQKIDAGIERQLRILTGDQRPNEIYTIPEVKRTHFERFNDFSADLMGSGLGVFLSLHFVGLWLYIGPRMRFNDNWWLIIGTFTGLVGFVNGFILRSLYYREETTVKEEFKKLAAADRLILDQLNVPTHVPVQNKSSFSERITGAISDACGHRYAPFGSIIVVVILLAIATVMRWSVTGQLLCNTPTMIIEGFLLIILINAHNHANDERDADFSGLLKRKLLLHGFVETVD